MAAPDSAVDAKRKLFPPGTLLGELRVVRLLARGTNADVYLVRDQQAGRLLVLKALHADRFASKPLSQQMLEGLKALTAARHPNVVGLLGAGDLGDRPYLLLEFVEGETLRQRVRAEPSTPHETIRVAFGIASGLVDGHKRTVFHHDLRPENVLLGKNGEVKVLELGPARLLRKALSPPPPQGPPATSAELEYLSPEQVKGDVAGPAADVWALGCMMFEMLGGVPPYQGRVVQVLADQIASTERVRRLPSSAKNIPQELADLVYRCLEKSGAQRPTSAEVAEALRKLMVPPPPGPDATPFRGLLPFTEADSLAFFGREYETSQLLERLHTAPVLTLTGPSGAGKTSFAMAAIVPKLRQDWHVVVHRPDAEPLRSLCAALLAGEPEEEQARWQGLVQAQPERLSVLASLRADKLGRRVAIVVDPLDIVLDIAPEQRLAYLRGLAGISNDRGDPVRAILVVRESALGALALDPLLAAAFSETQTLTRPSREMLLYVMQRAAAAVGHTYDDAELPQTIADALVANPAPLPLLGFMLETLFVRRDTQASTFTRAVYDSVGGVEGALTAYGESALSGANEAQLKAVRDIFLRLITDDDEPRAMAKSALLDGLGKDADAVLERLVHSRLLIERQGAGEPEIEIVHAVLLRAWPLFRQWLDDKRGDTSFLDELGKAALAWKKGGEREGDAWIGEPLRAAKHRLARSRQPAGPDILKFLAAGDRRQLRVDTRRRRILGGVWIAMIAFSVFALLRAVIAYTAKSSADEARARVEAERADAQREDARSATMRLRGVLDGSELLEARGQVRASLEHEDSTLARALWAELSSSALLWRKAVGARPAIAFSANGARIAAASGRVLHVLDATSAEDRALRGGHERDVTAVGFSADTLLSADEAGKVLAWNLSQATFEVVGEAGSAVQRLAVSPDGQFAAAATRDDVRVFTVASRGAEPRIVRGIARVVAFSADGSLLAGASGDKGSIGVLDAQSGTSRRSLAGHPEGVSALAFSADGLLASGGKDGDIKVWPPDKDTAVVLKWHDAAVNGLAFSAQGKALVSASADQTLAIGELQPDVPPRRSQAKSTLIGLSAGPDGAAVVTAASDGSMQVWSTAAPSAVSERRAGDYPHADVSAAAFGKDAGLFVTATEDGRVAVWDTAQAQVKKVVQAHQKRITAADVSADGKFVATASADGSVRLTSLPGGEELKTFTVAAGPVVRVHVVGKTVLSGHSDGRIRVWTIANAKARVAISAYSDRAIAFSPDGKAALTGGASGPAQVWKVASGRGGRTLSPSGARFTTATFSPDSKKIVTGDSKGRLQIWGAEAGASKPVGSHQGLVHQIAFDKGGKRLASVAADRTVMLWDLDGGEGKKLAELPYEPNAVAFSSDGKLILVGGDDGAVSVFDVASQQSHWRASLLVREGPELLTHSGWIPLGAGKDKAGGGEAWRKAADKLRRFGAESADGQYVCLAAHDKISLWDRPKDQELGTAPLTGLDDLQAFSNGCVSRAAGLVGLLPASGQGTNLSTTATAVGVSGDDILIAEGSNVVTLSKDGRRSGTVSVTPGATAVARGEGNALVLGFDGGAVEANIAGRVVPFGSGPAARIVRILAGPARTFAAADAAGFVAVWDGNTGRLLKQGSLHGRPTQLLIDQGVLYAVNDRGGFLTFDLSAFSSEYCSVLKDVWQRTPILWAAGRAFVQAPPSSHRCK